MKCGVCNCKFNGLNDVSGNRPIPTCSEACNGQYDAAQEATSALIPNHIKFRNYEYPRPHVNHYAPRLKAA